jgi:sporulation protein YlmC with PRC-barrel domain
MACSRETSADFRRGSNGEGHRYSIISHALRDGGSLAASRSSIVEPLAGSGASLDAECIICRAGANPAPCGTTFRSEAELQPRSRETRLNESFPPKSKENPMADLTVISSDEVEGASVYNVAGEKLGSIDDLKIDRYTGQVIYAVLEFGGVMGMGADRYPIPWAMLKYDAEKKGYVVPLDKAKLGDAPKYADHSAPAYDSTYGDRVDAYYNSMNW